MPEINPFPYDFSGPLLPGQTREDIVAGKPVWETRPAVDSANPGFFEGVADDAAVFLAGIIPSDIIDFIAPVAPSRETSDAILRGADGAADYIGETASDAVDAAGNIVKTVTDVPKSIAKSASDAAKGVAGDVASTVKTAVISWVTMAVIGMIALVLILWIALRSGILQSVARVIAGPV